MPVPIGWSQAGKVLCLYSWIEENQVLPSTDTLSYAAVTFSMPCEPPPQYLLPPHAGEPPRKILGKPSTTTICSACLHCNMAWATWQRHTNTGLLQCWQDLICVPAQPLCSVLRLYAWRLLPPTCNQAFLYYLPCSLVHGWVSVLPWTFRLPCYACPSCDVPTVSLPTCPNHHTTYRPTLAALHASAFRPH